MMDDLISRQEAVDKINERQRKLIYCFGFENDVVKIMDIAKSIIIAIPSAQPEIIYCKECKHWLDIDDGRQKHRMCADIYGDWFCADAERRTDA